MVNKVPNVHYFLGQHFIHKTVCDTYYTTNFDTVLQCTFIVC